MRVQLPGLVCALGLLAAPNVHAKKPPKDAPAPESADAGASLELGAEASSDGSGGATVESSTGADAQASKWNPRKEERWIRRWRPEPRMVELGVYGGVFLLNRDHELFDPQPTLALQGWQPLRQLNPDLGARVGYYPFAFVGFEAEGGAMPSQLDDGSSAVPFTVRGHVVGQLGRWSVTPFVLIGGGMLGLNSDGPLGTDIDPALHFGGGAKIFINRWVMLRLDLRDVVSHKLGVEETFVAHNFEALLGLSIVLNRRNTPRSVAHEPAPSGPGDRDGDQILDVDDQCVDVPENLNGYEDTDGCPEQDRDADGYWDDQDACPDEAGVDPDGCPVRDTDGDGILDDVDKCVSEPETFNGFQDDDGCPDDLPEEIKRFTGSIKGITFETNKATIRRQSLPTLDGAVQTLLQYPDVRIEIAGHTDNQGAHDHNMQLSKDRAESVKSYLVGMGVDENRIETVGHGPDKPVDSNDTKAGRANNRRIEFRVLSGSARAVPSAGE